ncbi:rifin [Plasmodium reichenowi]|uniref:Rifin n=1 Tax=Plasmodium reichenowi TaxID=5854 RepID=A0A060RLW0_PLARE|nr:rifin [Plasmodium reichenowi]
MKVHYINILLFALLLNVLAHNNDKPSITIPTPHTPTTRLLCECELYAPANYDNDQQMKEVMDNFHKKTQQRFHEYDDRMIEKQKQCKDRCDKEIQKIILKDKLEKQMEQQLTTLDTKITTDDIPTCICEKSLADKVEKGCLRCGGILGTAAPELGSIGGSLLGALYAWKPKAIADATVLATEAATKAATQAGMEAVRLKIKVFLAEFTGQRGYVDLLPIVNEANFKFGPSLVESARKLISETYKIAGIKETTSFQNTALNGGPLYVGNFGEVGATTYQTILETKTPVLQARYINAVKTAYGGYNTSIIAPIIAIVVIILIMVIIYLILRYRRKKKMKKKLQYIKLLVE